MVSYIVKKHNKFSEEKRMFLYNVYKPVKFHQLACFFINK